MCPETNKINRPLEPVAVIIDKGRMVHADYPREQLDVLSKIYNIGTRSEVYPIVEADFVGQMFYRKNDKRYVLSPSSVFYKSRMDSPSGREILAKLVTERTGIPTSFDYTI